MNLPVTRSRQSHPPRTNGKGKNLPYNNPCRRTPTHCESRDIQTDERNHSSDGSLACFGISVLARGDSYRADDELADDHEAASCDEDLSATEFLDNVERDGCGADVD